MPDTFNQNWVPRNIADIDNENALNDLGQPFFITRKSISHLHKKYVAKENDIYIATYPKCGTTWTIKIVEHLYKNVLDGIGGGMTENELAPWFETITSPGFRDNSEHAIIRANARETRVWKTHSSVGLLPKPHEKGKTIKVLVCLRHPLDVFVSTWHQVRRIKEFNYQASFRDFFRNVCLRGLNTDHFFRFHEEYFESCEKGEIKALFIRYEDMLRREGAIEAIEKIATFLEISEYDAKDIAEKTSFNSMRKLEEEKGLLGKDETFQKGEDKTQGSPERIGTNFIRAGKAGGWVDYLNEEDLDIWRNYVKFWEIYCPKAIEFFGRDFLLVNKN